MNKRKLALFLAIALILSLFPQLAPPAYAEAAYSGYCGGEGDGSNLQWSFDEDTGTLTIEGSGAMANYYWISDVPWYAYRGTITAVNLPDGLTSIGDTAFYYCSSLTSVTIPDSVTSIGNYAFYGCSALTTLIFPNVLNKIGQGAFQNCTSLTEISLSNSLKNIGVNAFLNCSSLEKLVVYSNQAYVYRTFASGADLQEVGFEDALGPADQVTIYGRQNPDAETIIIDRHNRSYSIYLPYFAKKYGYTFYDLDKSYSGSCGEKLTWSYDPGSKTLQIEGSGEMFDYEAGAAPWADFFDEIEQLSLSEEMSSIGNHAFNGCKALTSVTIPGSVTRIGDKALGYASNSEKVEGFTVYGYDDTAAQRYAEENEFVFVSLGPLHVHNLVHHAAQAPTCTEIGWEAYDTCTGCDYTTYVELPAMGHDWGKASYKWSDDNSSVTATRSCKRDKSHKETETVNTTYQVTREATTEAEGEGVYTATFTNEAFATQTKTVSIPKLVQNPFEDVKESDFYFNPVLWAVNNNVTSGRDATHFAPHETVKRSEAMLFFYAAKGRPKITTTKSPFKDVKKKHWFYDAVLWAVENKITSGTDATHFSPNKTCIRSEILQFLYAAMEKPAYTIENPYSDVKKKHWYYDGAIWAYEMGLERGSNGKFKAKTPCTRAYVVTYLYRFITGKELVK